MENWQHQQHGRWFPTSQLVIDSTERIIKKGEKRTENV